MTIIGLIGYSQVGKTTAASALTKAVPVNFADPLRDLTRHIDPVLTYPTDSGDDYPYTGSTPWNVLEQTQGYEWIKKNTDGRDFLVKLGDGARKLIDPDIWVTAWVNKATATIESGAAAVIAADVRYPNEAFAIRKMGGFTIHIERPGVGPANDTELGTIDEIVSKGLVTNHIENGGSEKDLRVMVAGLFPALVG